MGSVVQQVVHCTRRSLLEYSPSNLADKEKKKLGFVMQATIFPFQFRMLPLYSVSAPVQMTSPMFESVSPGTGFAPVTSPDGASSSSMVCPSREEKKEPESVPSKNTRFFTVLYPWMRRTKRGSS